MQVKVNREINYVEEANSILYNYINALSYDKMEKEGIKKITYSSDLYKKRFQKISSINSYVIENMRFEKSRLEYFFKEIGNSGMCLSNYLLPLYSEEQFSSVSEYETAEKSKSREEIIKKFDYILGEHHIFGNNNDEPVDTLEEIVRFMNKGDFSSEDKWKILQAIVEHKTHLEELCLILSKTVKLLEECKDDINELETEFYDYWLNYVNNNNFLEQLQKCTNISWKYSEKGNVIIPAIFHPHTITISITDDDNKDVDVIHIGIVLDSNFRIKQATVDSEDLNNALKLLSDKSKFEILRFIKEKPSYGFEIANELNLSTSTISYHMSGLIAAGLVKLEKDANKIYYSTNKEKIADILDDMGQLLL